MAKPRYTYQDKPIQSVTEVLSMLNKPLLLPWGVKVTAAAFKELVFNATGPGGNFCIDDLDAIEAEAKKAYRKKSSEAMATGTAVHDAIEQFVNGNTYLDQIPDGPVKRGLDAFITWGEEVELDIVAQEQQIFGWDFATYKQPGCFPLYAGRYDMLAHIDGILTMCDFKVAKDIYPEYWIQLNAYAMAVGTDLPEPITQVAVLRIDKETGVLYPEYQPVCEKKQNIFLMLARAKQLMKEVEKNGNN
jgi:hypothetical protein